MWLYFVIIINLCVCSVIVAVPTQNDIAKNFQDAVHHQNLESILMSIEERLRNLDNIYSMQLSPTIEDKLEQYQRKLESIDTKIIRLESLIMLNLDKISENISTKNFKDDIAKTNLAKKIDTMYDSFSHRLRYLDRKFETGIIKIQNKLETALTRVEKMEESLSRLSEDVEIELSDTIAALDDFKTSCSLIEQNILNNTNENFEVALKEQMILMQTFNDKTNNILKSLSQNTSESLITVENKVDMSLDVINGTDEFLINLEKELKRDLNDYAVKVSEMNSENWKNSELIQTKQTIFESIINSTNSELANGFKALMRFKNKDYKNEPQADQSQIENLSKQMDINFEKVLTTQNLFIDSCYRLQMDESQIESKISDILEKLIETFEKKTTVEVKDIINLENSIKNHHSHVTRSLYQTSTNIANIYEKFSKDHRTFEHELKQVADQLNALFPIIQGSLNPETYFQTSALILQEFREMAMKINSLNNQGDCLNNSMEKIEKIIKSLNETNSNQDYFHNISTTIAQMEAKVNKAYLYYFNRTRINAMNQNLTEQSQNFIEAINETKIEKPNQQKIDNLILEIFGEPVNSSVSTLIEKNQTTINYLDLIDVRANLENESTTESEEADLSQQ